MKIKVSAVLFFVLSCFHAQEIIDKDTLAIENEHPVKVIRSHQFTAAELDKIKSDFLDNSKNVNYHSLADYIFSRIDKKNFNYKVLYLNIIYILRPGCGRDSKDYSDQNVVNILKFKYFWDKRNFKEFVNLFSDKIIVPLPYELNKEYSEVYRQTGGTDYNGIPKSKIKSYDAYNAKGKFMTEQEIKKTKFYDYERVLYSDIMSIDFKLNKNKVKFSFGREDFYAEYVNSKYIEISESDYLRD